MLHLPTEAGVGFIPEDSSSWAATLSGELCFIVTVLCILASLPFLSRIILTLLKSLVSVKEAMMAHQSPGFRWDRNMAAITGIFPFLTAVMLYNLFPPLADYTGWDKILASLTVFFGYLFLRLFLNLCLKMGTRRSGASNAMITARQLPYSCFVAMSMVVVLTTFACNIIGVDAELSQHLLWGIIAVFYGIAVLQKLQIFVQYRGFFSGILYLCTLEFVPTGALLVLLIL